MKIEHAIAVFVLSARLSIAPAEAQSVRAPTAEERAMLANYANVLHRILDQIPNESWIENEHHRFDVDNDAEISNDPDVPLDINESITREYIIRPGSRLQEERVKVMEPLLEKFKANPSDPPTSTELQKAERPTRITVNVHTGQRIRHAPLRQLEARQPLALPPLRPLSRHRKHRRRHDRRSGTHQPTPPNLKTRKEQEHNAGVSSVRRSLQ
jgi:hypothetical protein